MSQVIDIYTLDSLQVNEIVFRASDSSPSIDDNHSTLSSSSQSNISLTQIFNSSPTPYWRPSDEFQKILRILSMKTTMRSFHVSPVHIVPVYYIHYRQNG